MANLTYYHQVELNQRWYDCQEIVLSFATMTAALVVNCVDRLVHERRNASALAMELCLSCPNPPMYSPKQ